jgi:hypothetical protein
MYTALPAFPLLATITDGVKPISVNATKKPADQTHLIPPPDNTIEKGFNSLIISIIISLSI